MTEKMERLNIKEELKNLNKASERVNKKIIHKQIEKFINENPGLPIVTITKDHLQEDKECSGLSIINKIYKAYVMNYVMSPIQKNVRCICSTIKMIKKT